MLRVLLGWFFTLKETCFQVTGRNHSLCSGTSYSYSYNVCTCVIKKSGEQLRHLALRAAILCNNFMQKRSKERRLQGQRVGNEFHSRSSLGNQSVSLSPAKKKSVRRHRCAVGLQPQNINPLSTAWPCQVLEREDVKRLLLDPHFLATLQRVASAWSTTPCGRWGSLRLGL